MRFYFDSAYIAKCYLSEPDGVAVRELARAASGLYSSALCMAEMACVFQRQIRAGTIHPDEAPILRKQFADDIGMGVWELIPVNGGVLERVEALVASLPGSCYIRAGDAIHLASAIASGFDELWTNDRHLLAAAAHAGLRGRSVA